MGSDGFACRKVLWMFALGRKLLDNRSAQTFRDLVRRVGY